MIIFSPFDLQLWWPILKYFWWRGFRRTMWFCSKKHCSISQGDKKKLWIYTPKYKNLGVAKIHTSISQLLTLLHTTAYDRWQWMNNLYFVQADLGQVLQGGLEHNLLYWKYQQTLSPTYDKESVQSFFNWISPLALGLGLANHMCLPPVFTMV